VETLESNTQGLSEEAINTLVPEADLCRALIADWDAWAICTWSKCS